MYVNTIVNHYVIYINGNSLIIQSKCIVVRIDYLCDLLLNSPRVQYLEVIVGVTTDI